MMNSSMVIRPTIVRRCPPVVYSPSPIPFHSMPTMVNRAQAPVKIPFMSSSSTSPSAAAIGPRTGYYEFDNGDPDLSLDLDDVSEISSQSSQTLSPNDAESEDQQQHRFVEYQSPTRNVFTTGERGNNNDTEFSLVCQMKKCERVFQCRSTYIRHFRRDHSQEANLDEHDHTMMYPEATATDDSKNSFSCGKCDYRCSSKSHLVSHSKIHLDKSYICRICMYRCTRKSNMVRHKRMHDEPFACSSCNFRCNNNAVLLQHNLSEDCKKPYQCSMCAYRCCRKSHLVSHTLTHSGMKPFACPLCSYRCARKSNLVRHQRLHSQPYSCPQCSFRCLRKCSMDLHTKQEHMSSGGDKRFKCSTCSYRSSKKSNVLRHERTHSGERPFACSKCAHRSATRTHMVLHELTHSGERPFPCPICPYRSSTKCNLVQHQRTHTGEKPFQCSVCQRRFSRKAHVLRHHRTKHPLAVMEEDDMNVNDQEEQYERLFDVEDEKDVKEEVGDDYSDEEEY